MLHLHRADRADALVAALADVLRVPPADPFAEDVVAVPSRGVERWLAQRLSHVLGATTADDGGDDRDGSADGVCAAVRFPAPAVLVDEVVAALDPGGATDDPWAPGRLLWAVLDVVDASAGEPWCAGLARHLGAAEPAGSHRHSRRLATARHLAALFDGYAAARPLMLRHWVEGHDDDGAGGPLDADLAWQAELWRRVRGRLGVPSPAERLPAACRALRDDPYQVDLPDRLSLFGPTRLTTAQLEVLAALAHGREVHLWLPHPSPQLWRGVAAYALGSASLPRRRADPSADAPRHPLLAGLGRDARELQLRLACVDGPVEHHHHPVAAGPGTLLGLLQRSLRDDLLPPPAGRPRLAPGDRSVQVHACHGPHRQVEVLRDVIVGLLADDPTLEPRDVLVMCPDIEDYAPLVAATFGLDDGPLGDRHPGHRLRVRLADRSLRQTNPLLSTLAALLDLADARFTASEVLDLVSSTPVRRRFGLSDDDLERLRQWVSASGVRWGIDAAHRRPFGLGSVPQNTWRAGLDRLLLGAAMAEEGDRWVGLALPLDDVDSSDIDLAGRLAELIDRLTLLLDDLAGHHPLRHWLDTLDQALDLLAAVPAADAWQLAQARGELALVAADAGPRLDAVPLRVGDVRALLGHRLQGRPTRANFRTGTLTMCSMVPMRSVPHRVVCLLGLDDGRFPRSAGIDGDDILARDPVVGERDPRAEDRQLLLDALLAAREHLVVLYTGADPRTNAVRPPAVPVGELLDTVDALVVAPAGTVRQRVVVRHPLQPFDARNFRPGALGPPRPFSFDTPAVAGAVRARSPLADPAPFLAAPLPPPAAGDVGLAELVALLEHPARAFLRQRLGVVLPRPDDDLADGLSVELDGLQRWALGDRLLASVLSGASVTVALQAEWRRGSLPPGTLGRRLLDAMVEEVQVLVAAAAAARQGGERAVDVAVDLGDRRLTGTVDQVFDDHVVRVVYSRLAPKHRLRAWVQLLALTVAAPGTGWRAVTVGRPPRGSGALRSALGPLDPAAAREELAALVDLHVRGLQEPLPMAVATSAGYAEKRARGMGATNALAAAGAVWRSRHGTEGADPPHGLVWGPDAPLAALLSAPAGQGETGPGWPADEPARFGRLARRVWDPLLRAERLEVP